MTTKADNKVDINSARTIAAIVLLGAFTPSIALLAPVVVGALVDELSFTPQQAGGIILTAELATMALATFHTLIWMDKVSWQKAFYVAFSVIVVCNFLSIYATTVFELAILRGIVGLAGGSVMSICMRAIGLAEKKERMFGFFILGQIIFSTIGLAAFPHLIEKWGITALYGGLVLLMAPLLFLIQYFPKAGIKSSDIKGKLESKVWVLGAFGLVSIFLFYVAIGGVWAFVERIADASGFEAKQIGYVLAIASLCGTVGSAAASAISDRLGQTIPIVAGWVLILLSLLPLFELKYYIIFLVASCAFKLGWTFTVPFMLASITSLDPTGRLIVMTNLIIGGGLAAGPAITSRLISQDLNYDPIVTFGLIVGVISCLLILPISRSQSHS